MPLNHLRFLVQDTEESSHFFEDEEILFISGEEANIYRAAERLCYTAAAKLAKTPSFDNEAVKYEADQKSKTFINLAKMMAEKAEKIDESLNTGSNNSNSGLNLPPRPSCKGVFTRDPNSI